jgi:hypothetical protein
MRRLMSEVGVMLGIMAATMIVLAVVGASQSWRESTMFTAGALAEWIIIWLREDDHDTH